MEYVNALASAERELESLRIRLKRVEGEKAWIAADHEALKEEQSSARRSTDFEREQLQQAMTALQARFEESQASIAVLEQHVHEREEHCRDLERRLQLASTEAADRKVSATRERT